MATFEEVLASPHAFLQRSQQEVALLTEDDLWGANEDFQAAGLAFLEVPMITAVGAVDQVARPDTQGPLASTARFAQSRGQSLRDLRAGTPEIEEMLASLEQVPQQQEVDLEAEVDNDWDLLRGPAGAFDFDVDEVLINYPWEQESADPESGISYWTDGVEPDDEVRYLGVESSSDYEDFDLEEASEEAAEEEAAGGEDDIYEDDDFSDSELPTEEASTQALESEDEDDLVMKALGVPTLPALSAQSRKRGREESEEVDEEAEHKRARL